MHLFPKDNRELYREYQVKLKLKEHCDRDENMQGENLARKALKFFPEDFGFKHALAYFLNENKDPLKHLELLTLLNELIDENPDDEELHSWIEGILKNDDELRATLEADVENDPTRLSSHVALLKFYETRGLLNSAKRSYTRAAGLGYRRDSNALELN